MAKIDEINKELKEGQNYTCKIRAWILATSSKCKIKDSFISAASVRYLWVIIDVDKAAAWRFLSG